MSVTTEPAVRCEHVSLFGRPCTHNATRRVVFHIDVEGVPDPYVVALLCDVDADALVDYVNSSALVSLVPEESHSLDFA